MTQEDEWMFETFDTRARRGRSNQREGRSEMNHRLVKTHDEMTTQEISHQLLRNYKQNDEEDDMLEGLDGMSEEDEEGDDIFSGLIGEKREKVEVGEEDFDELDELIGLKF